MAAPEAAISDLDDFLTTTLARQVEAKEAIHNGNPTPHLALWSWRDPVTLFGAGARGKQAGLSMTPQEVKPVKEVRSFQRRDHHRDRPP
jgi:hypothetical protein